LSFQTAHPSIISNLIIFQALTGSILNINPFNAKSHRKRMSKGWRKTNKNSKKHSKSNLKRLRVQVAWILISYLAKEIANSKCIEAVPKAV